MRREKKQTPESILRGSLQTFLKGTSAQRLFAVEEIVRSTFEAFAKNPAGKVPPQAIHSIVRSYFMEEHGWLLTGFEFSSARSIKLQEASILKDKAPAFVEALNAVEKLDHGLSLSDVCSIVAAIEQLILNESVDLLKGAYTLNKLSVLDQLNEVSLDDVLTSYLVIFREGSDQRNFTDFRKHQVYKRHAQKHTEDWDNLVTFERESVANAAHSGQFYSFEEASQIVRDLAMKYGDWQNSECGEIKDKLIELASDGSGRVPFQKFHDEPPHPHYRFTETLDYLRNISAVDDSQDGSPQIFLANYVSSQSNCIASSQYYSVCCLSECELLVNELEEKTQSSEVPLQQFLEAIAAISTSTVKAPRVLSEELVKKAHSIVANHWGLIPFHSGEFRQWLHHAFPNECPVPTRFESAAEDSEHEAADRWIGHNRVPMWQVSAQGELVSV